MSTLKVNSIIPTTGVPTGGGGGIVQTTVTTKTDTASQSVSGSQNSNDWSLESTIKGTITPTSSSSKILVRMMLNVSLDGTAGMHGSLARKVGSTETMLVGDDGNNRSEVTSSTFINNGHSMNAIHISYLDSPSTTSAVNYYAKINQMTGGGATLFLNRSSQDTDSSDGSYPRGLSTVILQEMSA